jgi:hypothetical protein
MYLLIFKKKFYKECSPCYIQLEKNISNINFFLLNAEIDFGLDSQSKKFSKNLIENNNFVYLKVYNNTEHLSIVGQNDEENGFHL